jgi:uncharacterized protein YukE
MSREYRRISDAADDAATRLKSVQGSGWLTDWQGEAADVFVDAIKDTPSDLHKLVESYSRAASALSGWADTVDDTQYRADGALADAKDAAGDLTRAQSRLSSAENMLTHYQSTASSLARVATTYPAGSTVPSGVDVPTASQLKAAHDNTTVAASSVSSAQGDVSAAQSRIDAAKRLVAAAKGDWQDGEQRTATALGDAADAGLGKQSFWSKLFHSQVWEDIVTVAKVVVAVGGIIAMIIPGPWTLIIAAVALIVLADTIYKMTQGQANGWDLAFALLDCVPAAGAVGELAKGTRLATSLAKVGSLSSRGADVVRSATTGFKTTLVGLRDSEKAQKAIGAIRHVGELSTSIARRATGRFDPFTERGVTLFDHELVNVFTATDAKLGRPGGVVFLFREGEALEHVKNPIDAAVQTGLAPRVADAAAKGDDVFGINFPLRGLEPRLPDVAEAAGNPNFVEGGHTALTIVKGHPEDAIINPMHEYVVDGGGAMPKGSFLFRLGENGEHVPIHRY